MSTRQCPSVKVKQDYLNLDIAIIEPLGYLDSLTCLTLERVLESTLKSKRCNIIVDLINVNYISTVVWNLFLTETIKLRKIGGNLILAQMKSDIFANYELMEINKFINCYSTLNEAILDYCDGFHLIQ